MKIKRLENLGVAPTPWQYHDIYWVKDAQGSEVVDCYRHNENVAQTEADSRLISAAPDLYQALREAIFHECYGCDHIGGDGNSCTYTRDCAAKVWRKALEKAGGME